MLSRHPDNGHRPVRSQNVDTACPGRRATRAGTRTCEIILPMRIVPPVGMVAAWVLTVGCASSIPNLHHHHRSPGMVALPRIAQRPPAKPTAAPAAESGTLTLAQAYALALARSEQVGLAKAAVTDAEIKRT